MHRWQNGYAPDLHSGLRRFNPGSMLHNFINMKTHYIIYKIINLINNNYYIGKHQTKNINDSYMGSGKLIQLAIKKYGIENFKKEILYDFDNEEEMNQKEIELVTEDVINDKCCYNICKGGEGGPHFKNKRHSDETKKKLSIKCKGHKLSNEARSKISKSNKNRIITEETRKKLSNSAKRSYKNDNIKIKISNSVKEYFDKIGRKNIPRIKHYPICEITINKKCRINKEDTEILIYIEELDYYLHNGWLVGRKQSTKNKIKNHFNDLKHVGVIVSNI